MRWERPGFRIIIIAMDTNDSARLNSASQPVRAFPAARLALLLPGLVIFAGYGLVYLTLHLTGQEGGHLARLVFVVLLIGCPLILTWAGLRLATIRIELGANSVTAHPGFPARDPVVIAYRDLDKVRVRKGLSGRLTGASTLILTEKSGRQVRVEGIAAADEAASALNGILARL